MYFRGASVLILVFDSTSPSSFEHVQNYWTKFAAQHINNPQLVTVLVESKIDLPTNISLTAMAEQFAAEKGFMFCRTSAAQNIGIQNMMQQIAEKLIEYHAPTVIELGIRPEFRPAPIEKEKTWSDVLSTWYPEKWQCRII
jgi:GTPase SAR1 family protein